MNIEDKIRKNISERVAYYANSIRSPKKTTNTLKSKFAELRN